jgi:hypothetical protein
MKTNAIISRLHSRASSVKRLFVTLIYFMVTAFYSFAQDGNAGITEATTRVRGYFDDGSKLVYAICAIVGLVGAIKVYKKWNDGDHDTAKVATSWFGSCIFVAIVTTVLKSFFGV